MRVYLWEIYSALRRSPVQFAAFELWFKALLVAIFSPAFAWLTTTLVAWSGDRAVSNYDLVSFFLSPKGVLFLASSAALGSAIAYLDHGGLVILSVAVGRGDRVNLRRLLFFLGRRFPRLVDLGLRQFVVLALLAVPFLALGGITYAVLLSESDINYYLTARPLAFWVALAIGGTAGAVFAILALLLVVQWCLSVPILLFEQKAPRDALKESRGAVKTNFREILLRLVVCGLSVLAVMVTTGLIYAALRYGLLRVTGGHVTVMLVLVAAFLSLGVLLATLVSIFASVSLGITVAGFYRSVRPEGPLPPGLVRDVDAPALTRHTIPVLWVLVLGLLGVTLMVSFLVANSARMPDRVDVTAHRGGSRAAPENTIAAILQAIEDGADYAEIDVQETRDGVVVLFHDTDFMRTSGISRKIWETDYEELQEIDVGSWFAPEFADERVPTLKDAIEVAKEKIKLNIELKFNSHDHMLAERVARVVHDASFEENCIVTSLNGEGIRTARQTNGRLRTGIILTKSVGNVNALDVDILSVSAASVNRRLIRRAHRAGKRVHVWTVNDPVVMNTMIHLGVDNIITDVPDVLVELLEERTDLSNSERLVLYLGDFLEGRL